MKKYVTHSYVCAFCITRVLSRLATSEIVIGETIPISLQVLDLVGLRPDGEEQVMASVFSSAIVKYEDFNKLSTEVKVGDYYVIDDFGNVSILSESYFHQKYHEYEI